MSTVGAGTFDQWLGQELRLHASANTGPNPLPAQAQYQAAYVNGAVSIPLLAKVGAVLTTKAAIGVTAGVLAVGAAGASEAAITGSANPSDWGKQVVKQVNDCKAALAPGTHGIGECVSSFASQHGNKGGNSADHRNNPTTGHAAHTPGRPPSKGKPSTHPSPPSHAHPTPPKKKK
jgi:type IV secretory pathway TrbL component